MCGDDLEVIAPLVVEYYNWLSNNGGRDPQIILEQPLTKVQRKLLLERMDDVNVVWSITSPLRRNAHLRQARRRTAAGANAQEVSFLLEGRPDSTSEDGEGSLDAK